MADEIKAVTWENALVIDKSIKEGKSGEYFRFSVKQKKSDNYPKDFSWFTKTDEEIAAAKEIHKNDTVNLIFIEKPGEYQGKTVTYRNITKIEKVIVEESVNAEPETEETREIKMQNAVNETALIAAMVKEKWIEGFIKDENLKDIPMGDKVSIFSTMFIQATRTFYKGEGW